MATSGPRAKGQRLEVPAVRLASGQLSLHPPPSWPSASTCPPHCLLLAHPKGKSLSEGLSRHQSLAPLLLYLEVDLARKSRSLSDSPSGVRAALGPAPSLRRKLLLARAACRAASTGVGPRCYCECPPRASVGL